jgi:hypothetical protein
MKLAKEKSNSKFSVYRQMKNKVTVFLSKHGEARIDDAGFLLDLLESGCSRNEIEDAMNLTLHDPITIRRFIGQRKINHFNQLESQFGFAFALHLCLHNRIRKAEERNYFIKTMAYPIFLILTGYCVLSLFLFVIAPTIQSNSTSLTQPSTISSQSTQVIFILLSLVLLFSFILLIYALISRPYVLYMRIAKYAPQNPWIILESRKLAFHIRKIYELGLSTREIYLTIEKYPGEPILTRIVSNILKGLEAGNRIQDELSVLDPFLTRILGVDIHPDFMARLMDYERIAQKRYVYSVKKIGYFTTLIAYVFISVLILTLYQTIMTPLDMLRNMG